MEVAAFYRQELRPRGWRYIFEETVEYPHLQMCWRSLLLDVLTLHPPISYVGFESIPSSYLGGCAEDTPLPPAAVALVAVASFTVYIVAAWSFQRRARRARGDPLRAADGIVRWGPAFAFVPYLILDWRAGPGITPGEPIVIFGLALVILGAAFALWAAARLGSDFDLEPEVHARHGVVRAGPYRFVRHPVYVGIAVHLIGACIASGILVLTLGVLLVGLPLLYLRARAEEQLLRAELGSSYDAYAHEVGMFFPRLRRLGG